MIRDKNTYNQSFEQALVLIKKMQSDKISVPVFDFASKFLATTKQSARCCNLGHVRRSAPSTL